MQYGILGPLELLADREQVRVPGGRQRELIAILVVHAGQTLSTDRLVDQLWGIDLPHNPENALQQRIVQVRRLLDPATGDVLRTVSSGYQLDVDDDAIDARRFERMASAGHHAMVAGDPVRAAGLLSDALALWRGPALEDVDAPWAQAEARRLEELRVAACEDRADAQLALGEHVAAAAELEGLVDGYPLRERLRGQLMTALARSGRQAEALAVYAAARELLAQELGIDPSPQLQRIHADVLNQRDDQQPPPVSTARPPSEGLLPAPASTFVGREKELAQLADLLAGERIVTLSGPGGAGKTRLAIEAARRVSEASPKHIVRFVDLAPVTDGEAVAPTLAGIVGAGGADQGAPSVVEVLQTTLTDRQTLLLLDNCEHLVDAVCQLVDTIVTRCPGVQVLATSREPLGVDGEIVWPLPTLSVPTAATRTVRSAAAHAAVRLFCDRVRAVVPGYELTEPDVAAVVQIVRRLDGLPLAIELAAARAKVLSVAEIADRLGDRFQLLSGGRRTAPTRHRALRDTLEWSWDLLDDADRRSWMAAAVPAGPFTADLLAPLLNAAGVPTDAMTALTALTDRSLLTVHERGVPTRYRMLETLREFGTQRLAAAGLEETLRNEHARVVDEAVATADRTTPQFWDVDLDIQRGWLPEARAAMRWRASRGDWTEMQRLASRLGWLWYLTALAPEGLRWLDDALGPIGELDLEAVEPAAVLWAAALRVNEAPHDDGLRWAQLAVDAAEGDVARSLAEVFVWTHHGIRGDTARVTEAVRQRGYGEGWLEGVWRLLEAQMLAQEGDVRAAERLLDHAEELLVDHGAWWGVWTSATLAQLAQLRGDAAAMKRVIDRALPICLRMGVPELEVELRGLLAMVAAATADDTTAHEELRQSEALTDRTRVAMSRALVANAYGHLHRIRGELDVAQGWFEQALAVHDRAGQPFGRPFTLWGLGHLALAEGATDRAGRWFAESHDSAMARGDGDAIACALEGLAAWCAVSNNSPMGGRLLGAAVARREEMHAPAPIISHADVEAAIRHLRMTLSAQELVTEQELGRAMDDAAIREALDRALVSGIVHDPQ